jgi:predicted membrane protein
MLKKKRPVNMQNEQPDHPSLGNHPPSQDGGWCFLALFIGVALTVLMTTYPHIAAKPDGSPDMFAAALIFTAMCMGFVRGVGFTMPGIFRYLFSLPVIFAILAGVVVRLEMTGSLDLLLRRFF